MHYALITFHSSKRSLYSLTYLQHCIRQSSVCNLWLLTEDVHHTVSFLLITYEDNLQFDDLFQSLEPVLLQKPCEATPLSFQIKKKRKRENTDEIDQSSVVCYDSTNGKSSSCY